MIVRLVLAVWFASMMLGAAYAVGFLVGERAGVTACYGKMCRHP